MDFDFAQYRMINQPLGRFVRHDFRDRFAISANDECLTLSFNFQQNSGQLRFGFVHIQGLHKRAPSFLVNLV